MNYNINFDNKSEVINKKDTRIIECSNPSCKKQLLITYHIPRYDKKINYNLRVECPFCSRHSYDFEVLGDLSWIICEGVLIVDYVEDEKNNTVIVKTKVK